MHTYTTNQNYQKSIEIIKNKYSELLMVSPSIWMYNELNYMKEHFIENFFSRINENFNVVAKISHVTKIDKEIA